MTADPCGHLPTRYHAFGLIRLKRKGGGVSVFHKPHTRNLTPSSVSRDINAQTPESTGTIFMRLRYFGLCELSN